MDRLVRNLDDLRRLVQTLNKRAIRIEFVKECLSFMGEDSPMANLLRSVMAAFAEFERALIGERQREGIALAKQRGAYRGRKKALVDTRLSSCAAVLLPVTRNHFPFHCTSNPRFGTRAICIRCDAGRFALPLLERLYVRSFEAVRPVDPCRNQLAYRVDDP